MDAFDKVRLFLHLLSVVALIACLSFVHGFPLLISIPVAMIAIFLMLLVAFFFVKLLFPYDRIQFTDMLAILFFL